MTKRKISYPIFIYILSQFTQRVSGKSRGKKRKVNYSYQVRSHIFVYCKGPAYCLMKVMKAACRPCCLVPIHRCSAPSVVDCVGHVRVSPRPPSLQPANCSNNLHTSALFQINSATMVADHSSWVWNHLMKDTLVPTSPYKAVGRRGPGPDWRKSCFIQ